ncbi:interleukin-1 receptor-associated kinase 1 isoform X1 [Labrus mixtus]|uniref:interleukin-1 receptor-associated kinase 1 isoform X1 n=1 Tax=Labrus mixtus TaxID=508554 RepID=UPI0029BFD4F3|nr:interleukin-1 receptor-associated kinase 1 isoform X1 [Labrus mixtus]
MSSADPGDLYLYSLPASVLHEFCLIMDGLSDLDWCRFASLVLCDQTSLRLAQRREGRTDWVMNQWVNRNGRVSELVNLLEHMQLFRPRDVIRVWVSDLRPSSLHPFPPPPPPPPPLTLPQFEPPPKQSEAPPTQVTCSLLEAGKGGGRGGGGGGGRGGPLPGPAPPPLHLHSALCTPPERPPVASCSRLMCWSYKELHDGTSGFSPSLQVGEGGFGVVYKATLRSTCCAVKRIKQDFMRDWDHLKKSFQTEVDKLTTFRHPNIVELLGFSEGPDCVCLIYSYMENRSLDDQLHNESRFLSWPERVSVVEGASKALKFLHCPPEKHITLIHGDVKSSNILLDRHMVAKLADFGLARFARRSPAERSAAQTASIGMTETVRGTLAYLPDEYVRNGQLGTAVDVYSFGVVLLEVLTGRRAMERGRTSAETYLKDLVEEVEDSPAGSCAAEWRKQLDHRLISGGAAEPVGHMEMVFLACSCLDKNRKKRPKMEKVFDQLQDIHSRVREGSCSSASLLHHPHLQPPSLPRPPHSLDSSVEALSQQMSKVGPLEDTYQLSMSSSSSCSSFCSLTPPDPLHSSSSLPSSSSSSLPSSSSSSSLPPCSSSFVGPRETDESRGFSQYDLRSPCRSNGTSSRSLSPSTRDQNLHPTRPSESQFSQPSIPTENQYNSPTRPGCSRDSSGVLTGGAATADLYGVPGSLSPVGSLQSLFPRPPVVINPIKERFLQKKSQYDEGRIRTPELLSADDLYEGRSSEEGRGPEESDELDYLPAAKHT